MRNPNKKEIAKVQEYAKLLSLANLAEDDLLFQNASKEQIIFLAEVLQRELEVRREKGIEKRIKLSQIPEIKKFEDFDITFNKKITKEMLGKLDSLEWLFSRYNIVFVGGAETGKTHLAISLGLRAIHGGYKVAFASFYELILMLKTSEHIKTHHRRLQFIKECAVLIIDEIGYSTITRDDANLFYRFLSEINGKLSIIITTNLPFSEWGELLSDQVLATAIVDRLTHRCQIISTGSKSYRLANHKNLYNL